MTLLLAITTAHAACVAEISPSDLDDILTKAEAGYAAFDEDRFLDGVDQALIRTPCLDGPVDPSLAARLHRILAIRRFAEAPTDATQSAVAAARANPELGIAALVGDSHPLALAWSPAPPTERLRLRKPSDGTLWLDGAPARTRAADAPALVQLVRGDGSAAWSALTAPSQPLPEFDALPVARAPLRWTAAGSAAGAAGLYVVAWTQAQRFDDALDADQLRSVQTTTNASLVGSGALATAAVSTLLASFLVR